jgi:hypothetical protein
MHNIAANPDAPAMIRQQGVKPAFDGADGVTVTVHCRPGIICGLR